MHACTTSSPGPPYAEAKGLGQTASTQYTCMHGSQFYHCRIADAIIEIQDIPLIQVLEKRYLQCLHGNTICMHVSIILYPIQFHV